MKSQHNLLVTKPEWWQTKWKRKLDSSTKVKQSYIDGLIKEEGQYLSEGQRWLKLICMFFSWNCIMNASCRKKIQMKHPSWCVEKRGVQKNFARIWKEFVSIVCKQNDAIACWKELKFMEDLVSEKLNMQTIRQRGYLNDTFNNKGSPVLLEGLFKMIWPLESVKVVTCPKACQRRWSKSGWL